MVHNTGSFFSSVIHQSVSHRGPIICHLKLLKIGWTFLNAVLLWWHRVLAAEEGKTPFCDFLLPPYPLCPGKAMWFLAPSLINLEFILYQLYPPSLSLMEASSVVVFVFLSREEKENGAYKRPQSSTILMTPASKCVKRTCTKAIWWEKKKIKSWSKSRGCFLQRRSQDLESIPPKGDPKGSLIILPAHAKKAHPDLLPPSWALLICLQLAQLWEGPGGSQ